MFDYLTPIYGSPLKELKIVTDETIELGQEIQIGFNKDTGKVFKPVLQIIEQRPAKGYWKKRPTFYHVSV